MTRTPKLPVALAVCRFFFSSLRRFVVLVAITLAAWAAANPTEMAEWKEDVLENTFFILFSTAVVAVFVSIIAFHHLQEWWMASDQRLVYRLRKAERIKRRRDQRRWKPSLIPGGPVYIKRPNPPRPFVESPKALAA